MLRSIDKGATTLNQSFRTLKTAMLSMGFAFCASAYAGSAQSPALSVGVNYSVDFQPYKGHGSYQSVLPTFFYDNNRVYVQGDEAGLYLLKNSRDQLALNVYYDSHSYDPAGELHLLNKRKWSVMSGASYLHITPYGGFKVGVGTDVLSRNKGTVVTASYLAELHHRQWSFYPEFGLQWNDAKYNQYYFGVSDAEALQSGIAHYQPKQSIHPYASFATSYHVSKQLSVFSTVDLSYLSDEQYKSPMVRRRTDISPSFGISYTF
ncbi:MipA/OmpV family protein [Acinetobacter sp. WZC-1]|uniref:MipA/OmpV family protein n=1 Tax=Acinetobacter sp. WZC-1 TaxID=3459034 RepID=UPI00403E0725